MIILNNKQQNRDLFADIGIALILIGVPLAMYLNYYFPIVDWSPVIMALSVILVMSFRNLLKIRFPLFNRIGTIIVFYQIIMILYGLYSDKMDFRLLSFHLYIIVLFVALSSNSPRLSFESTKTCIFVVSAIVTLLGAFTLFKGLITGSTIFLFRENDENSILDLLTMSYGFLINFIAGLFVLRKNKVINIIILIFISIDFYLMLFLGKRTALLIALISFFFFIYTQPNFKVNILRGFAYLSSLLILMIVIYTTNDQIKEQINRVFLNIYLGIAVIFGSAEADLFGSAISRVILREKAFEMINSDFNHFNLLFGKGYMTIVLDNPVLQSYVDMGIIGFILFFFLILMCPFWILMKSFKLNDSSIKYFYLFTIYNTLSAFHSGIPYAYIKYTPILLLAFIVRNNKLSMHPKKILNVF